MTLCRFAETHTPGVWTCAECHVPTPRGQRYERPPVRPCPGIPDGATIDPGKVEIPESFAADLHALGVEVDDRAGSPGSLPRLFGRWREAIARWNATGRPERTDEEVAACLAVCHSCPHFGRRLGLFGYCTLCGCHVNGKAIGELDKARMATEDCPMNRWPKKTRPLEVVFMTHALNVGGAERWCCDVPAGFGPEIHATIAVTQENTTPQMVARARQAADLVIGEMDAREVLDGADVAVWWSQVPFGKARRNVFCSHGADEWGRKLHTAINAREDVMLCAVSQVAGRFFKRPFTVMHNGSDPERLGIVQGREKTRAELELADDEIAILYVGRFNVHKHPEAAAIAAVALCRSGRPARAMYLGDQTRGNYPWQQAVEICEAAGCPPPIFLGSREHLGDVLAAADCGILVSRSEGHSLAVNEAALFGLPMVGTRVGVIPELERQYGPLIMPVTLETDGDELASAVELAVSDENKPVVRRAQMLAEREFTLAAMSARWQRLLLNL